MLVEKSNGYCLVINLNMICHYVERLLQISLETWQQKFSLKLI